MKSHSPVMPKTSVMNQPLTQHKDGWSKNDGKKQKSVIYKGSTAQSPHILVQQATVQLCSTVITNSLGKIMMEIMWWGQGPQKEWHWNHCQWPRTIWKQSRWAHVLAAVGHCSLCKLYFWNFWLLSKLLMAYCNKHADKIAPFSIIKL